MMMIVIGGISLTMACYTIFVSIYNYYNSNEDVVVWVGPLTASGTYLIAAAICFK